MAWHRKVTFSPSSTVCGSADRVTTGGSAEVGQRSAVGKDLEHLRGAPESNAQPLTGWVARLLFQCPLWVPMVPRLLCQCPLWVPSILFLLSWEPRTPVPNASRAPGPQPPPSSYPGIQSSGPSFPKGLWLQGQCLVALTLQAQCDSCILPRGQGLAPGPTDQGGSIIVAGRSQG